MPQNNSRSDAELLTELTREMRWDPRIDQAPIEVVIEEGVVTFSGVVENVARKLAAIDAASRVKGVRGVIDNVEIRTPPPHRKHRV